MTSPPPAGLPEAARVVGGWVRLLLDVRQRRGVRGPESAGPGDRPAWRVERARLDKPA
ncbi:hypothetical protein [Microtetraspora sp. NBRC 16547]|uniref:hypothetical protein n=1 Tax=Microtetraspora sp. NBRC 16547 TaxID=3030993 RepID=UPI00255776AA|nr:hypothetical protein [Microtetraspora sp. NBRC 16547]